MFGWFKKKKYVVRLSISQVGKGYRYSFIGGVYKLSFFLGTEMKEWLKSNNKGSYKFKCQKSRSKSTGIDFSAESSYISKQIFEECRPSLEFSNRDDALLFKLTWS
jgi:hypothetical protein